MRTKALQVFSIGILLATLPFAVFGAGKPEASKDATINMFQLKVEIKDAIDGYAAKYSDRKSVV